MKTATWADIESDVRLGLFLVTANAQAMIGYDNPASIAIGRATFGDGFPEGGSVTGHVVELEDLAEYDVHHTGFWKVARGCYDFIHDAGTPLDRVDHGHIEAEYGNWLGHFLSGIPTDSYATHLGDLHIRFLDKNPEFPLPRLSRATSAKLNLISFLHSLRFELSDGIGFAPWEIAALGDMSLASVRNFIGPEGSDKPMMSRHGEVDSKSVYAEPLDALEWLAGRRGFNVGVVSGEWFDEVAGQASTPQLAGAVVGVFAWINGMTTETIADRADMPTDEIRAWTRGDLSAGATRARDIASAIGVNPDTYAAIVDRVTAANPKP